MQISLNIDSSNIGGTIEQVFADLSHEEKRELAKTVMLEVLRTPMESERVVYERQVIDTLIEETKGETYSSYRITDAASARSSHKYRERMQKFQSTSDRMMTMIVNATVAHYKELVTELVKNDEQLAAQYVSVRDKIVADFPATVQTAMALQFASQMGQVSNFLLQQQVAPNQAQVLALSIQQQLSNQGIHIQL